MVVPEISRGFGCPAGQKNNSHSTSSGLLLMLHLFFCQRARDAPGHTFAFDLFGEWKPPPSHASMP